MLNYPTYNELTPATKRALLDLKIDSAFYAARIEAGVSRQHLQVEMKEHIKAYTSTSAFKARYATPAAIHAIQIGEKVTEDHNEGCTFIGMRFVDDVINGKIDPSKMTVEELHEYLAPLCYKICTTKSENQALKPSQGGASRKNTLQERLFSIKVTRLEKLPAEFNVSTYNQKINRQLKDSQR